jgi:MFS transporter, NNP family, nitrate/nitrite transporter
MGKTMTGNAQIGESPAEARIARDRSWLTQWTPEDNAFWENEGKRVAWRTLALTTFNLLLAFAAWFVVSASVVKLSGIGFQLTKSQEFWLTAMPGLSAGTLRIIHTFLIPIFGTRRTISISTILLLIPLLGWGWAVQNPQTPYSVLLLLAFLAGLGGGNFSSFMPSTSLFFPKRLQGTALGIQAGIGNFGVSVVQFLTPVVIGGALFGAMGGGSQTFVKKGVSSQIWLQNAFYLWVPLVVIGAILAWFMLRSVPVRASFREQSDIFKDKHTWFMTSLYIMTFGSFSGFSAVFPLMIKNLFGDFKNAPDPLAYAFLGPLIGSASRVLFGSISDKVGGGKVTMLSGLGLLACAFWASTTVHPQSAADFGPFLYAMLGLFLFSGIGNASTFKQIPMIFPPRQAGGVIGWTAAVAAYGPFLFGVLIAAVRARTGSPQEFFYGIAVFYALNIALNWWFYARRGAEKPC